MVFYLRDDSDSKNEGQSEAGKEGRLIMTMELASVSEPNRPSEVLYDVI